MDHKKLENFSRLLNKGRSAIDSRMHPSFLNKGAGWSVHVLTQGFADWVLQTWATHPSLLLTHGPPGHK
jgi:hypothetical protein